MATESNIVTLSVSSYNQVKSDNYRLNMFLDNILLETLISEDHEHLVFDSAKVEQAVKFCFPERYKKKLSSMKTQASRYGTNVAPERSESND